eukprot:142913_1
MAQSNHSNRCITYMVYHSIHVILLDLINRILMQRVQGFGEHIEGSLIPFIGESNTYNHSDSFITNASQIHRIITQFRGKDNAIMRAIMQVMLFLANPSGFGWFVTFHRFWLHWNNEICLGDYECVTLFIVAVMLFLYIGFIMDLHRMESNKKHIDLWCMMVHFGINFYVRFTQIWTENRAKFESINTSGTSIGPFDDEYVLSRKIWDPGGVAC